MKADKSLESFKTADEAIRSGLEARRLIGADVVKKPGKNATPEEIAAFHKALGQPEKPDGYTFPTEGLPDGFLKEGKWDANTAAKLQQVAHESGLTPVQAARLSRQWAAIDMESRAAVAQQAADKKNAIIGELKQQWGTAFDQRQKAAASFLRTFSDKETFDHFEANGHLYPAKLVNALAEAQLRINGDEIIGAGPSHQNVPTPSQAIKTLGDRKRDAAFMKSLKNPGDPGHKEALKEWNDLHLQAYPEPVKR